MPIPIKDTLWRVQVCEANQRGPAGHCEIVTDAPDRRQCIVQCIFSKTVAQEIVNLHNNTTFLPDES